MEKVGKEPLMRALFKLNLASKSTVSLFDRPLPPIDEKLANIDDHLLAFIHGDQFSSGTAYEGGDPIKNIIFLLEYLREQKKFCKASTLKLLEELVKCEQGFPLKQIPTPSGMLALQKDISAYAESISQKVLHLKPGDRFLMEGGWIVPNGGHAMLALIEKEADHTYTFTLINTGAGIEYHENEKGPHTDVQWQLMKRSAENFARLALKLRKSGVVEKEDLQQAQLLCDTILLASEKREAELSAQNTIVLGDGLLHPARISFGAEIAVRHTPPKQKSSAAASSESSPPGIEKFTNLFIYLNRSLILAQKSPFSNL